MHFLIDPVVLTLPERTADEETILRFVENLHAWSAMFRRKDSNFFVSQAYIDVLYEMSLFPTERSLRSLFLRAEVESIDPKTVLNACSRILSNMPFFEERVEVAEHVAVYHDQVEVDPDLIKRLQEPVASAFRDTLGCVAYAKEELAPPLMAEMYLVTHPVDGPSASIEAKVETNDKGTIHLETEFPLLTAPEHLIRIQGIQQVWHDYPKAVDWAIDDLRCTQHLPADQAQELAPYVFAPEFRDSIERYGFHNRVDILASLYRSIAQLLTRLIPPQSTAYNHLLRDVQCNRRDHAGRIWEPWRLWITRGKPAVRLHYWCHKGYYIFSRVVVHDDMSIGPVPADCPL